MNQNESTGRISLKIDLSTGTIEIDAPAGEFHQTVDKAKELLGQMPAAAPAVRDTSSTPAAKIVGQSVSTLDRPKAKSGKSSGGSQARAGRIGSFEPIDMGLTESQERELRAFMEAKRPPEQPDQVAVALYKGEQLLGRRGFGYNEIYSLLRLSGIRELPKALDVLLARMMDSQWVVRDGPQQFALKFIARDHVEHKLGQEE
ncbi:hypothetical protein [Mesorhizobium sp. B2-1-3A]|uniref:hypothetical protein n=1 Tax=Mesorhizobium sp. B2-1-3A TaxID=2589971 RepID=UPI00112CB57C|nr:hypothetical protein [Mesorhizobium sp. B2-1-3A]TPM91620.1 hypothetical protein FJ977_32560 [Mesorhizobium sp. B2-1-3A]